jgi:prevent-host-death family protein
MNMTIGVAEAKAKLSELVDRVETGDTIVISRNGKPIVEMRPIRRVSPDEVVKRIRALRARIARRNADKPAWPGRKPLRQLAHEGHRR